MKVRPIDIQTQKFVALLLTTDYEVKLSEVQPELFEITAPHCCNKLYIKLLSASRRGYLKEKDRAFLEEAWEESNFAYAAYGADDAFNCVMAYLRGKLYFDCIGQSMYWESQYCDNGETTMTRVIYKLLLKRLKDESHELKPTEFARPTMKLVYVPAINDWAVRIDYHIYDAKKSRFLSDEELFMFLTGAKNLQNL